MKSAKQIPHARDKPEKKRCTDSDGNQVDNGLTALVVDEDQAMLELAAGMLRKIGYQVSVAEEGAQALFDFHQSPRDLVLTDLDMPAINGYQLSRRIKIQRPGTRVLIMTDLSRAAVASLMTDSHIDGWLFKPFRLDELKTLLPSTGRHTGAAGLTKPAA